MDTLCFSPRMAIHLHLWVLKLFSNWGFYFLHNPDVRFPYFWSGRSKLEHQIIQRIKCQMNTMPYHRGFKSLFLRGWCYLEGTTLILCVDMMCECVTTIKWAHRPQLFLYMFSGPITEIERASIALGSGFELVGPTWWARPRPVQNSSFGHSNFSAIGENGPDCYAQIPPEVI